MNPLQEARYRATRSWRTARDGTRRTAGWVAGGVGSAFGGAGRSVAGVFRRNGRPEAESPPAAVAKEARSGPRRAILWAGGILVLAWIGWTVFVWVENGAGAGVGVLISWPAVFAALALIASPFIGVGILVRRHQVAADGPAVAEDGDPPEETGAEGEADPDEVENEASEEEEAPDEEDAPEENGAPEEDEADDREEDT